jgi:hypothetical protein
MCYSQKGSLKCNHGKGSRLIVIFLANVIAPYIENAKGGILVEKRI